MGELIGRLGHVRSRGEFSRGVTPRGKPGPGAPRGALHGVNDYTGWFAGDKDMAGNYSGYDGPCPPAHSTHRYLFDLYALNTRLNLPPGATKKQLLDAMNNRILAHSQLTGRYQR